MKQEMMGFLNGSGINWTTCKQSAPRPRHNHTKTSSLNFYRMNFIIDTQATVSKSLNQFTDVAARTLDIAGYTRVYLLGM